MLTEVRCECGKLLFKSLILEGEVEVRCRHCKRIFRARGLRTPAQNPDRYLLSVDDGGHIVDVNENAPALLGYSRNELLARTCDDVLIFFASHRAEFFELVHMSERVLFSSFDRLKDGSLAPVFASLHGREDGYLIDIERRTSRNRRVALGN